MVYAFRSGYWAARSIMGYGKIGHLVEKGLRKATEDIMLESLAVQ
jgi:hypothetical protein